MVKLFEKFMDRDDNHVHGFSLKPTAIALMGVFFGALMVAVLHCIFNGRNSSSPSTRHQTRTHQNTAESTTTVIVPVSRYSKEHNDDTCSVCLSEFKDGDQIRVLPDCLHVFHVTCIDTWLISHSNCPLCRANIVPPTPPQNDNNVVVRIATDSDRSIAPSWNPI